MWEISKHHCLISTISTCAFIVSSCASVETTQLDAKLENIEFPKLASGYDWSPTKKELKGKLLLDNNCLYFKKSYSKEPHVIIWPQDADLISMNGQLIVKSKTTSGERADLSAIVGQTVVITGNLLDKSYESQTQSVETKVNGKCMGRKIVHAHFWTGN